jgi:hypothetical protein
MEAMKVLWQSATGTIGYVINSGTKTGNTEFFSNAAENNLAGLIRVNKDYNCGKIEGNDCVPIFKGTGIDAVKEANGGSIPSDIPFIAMSKDAGEILEAAIFNATGQPGVLEMIMDVTNDQERTIYVPCGEIKGKSSELVIVGGHHDTVYHGEGAVDDTSGTASVLEMARQLSDVINETGTPERTLRFCTWGGEEEGLYGSRAYVSAFQNSLKDNLRLYINLDMNHVDADFSARGNSLRLFGNTADDMEHIERITELYKNKRSDVADRYDIQLALYKGAQGEPDGMPYNSDHGPFVYDLGDDIRGRAVVCYGSGSWEYHTYLDTMEPVQRRVTWSIRDHLRDLYALPRLLGLLSEGFKARRPFADVWSHPVLGHLTFWFHPRARQFKSKTRSGNSKIFKSWLAKRVPARQVRRAVTSDGFVEVAWLQNLRKPFGQPPLIRFHLL